MSKKELTIYLNDHLAGSVGALELIDHLIETYSEKPLGQFFKDLRNEIGADQSTLKDLIEKLGEQESPGATGRRLGGREVFSLKNPAE